MDPTKTNPVADADPIATAAAKARRVVGSEELSRMMAANDPLSAAIAESAGFHGIWASARSIADKLARRHARRVRWADVASAVLCIRHVVDIPVLVDATGMKADPDDASACVRALAGEGVAGICLDDCGSVRGRQSGYRYPVSNHDAMPGKGFFLIASVDPLAAPISARRDRDRVFAAAEAAMEAGADALWIRPLGLWRAGLTDIMRRWPPDWPLILGPTACPSVLSAYDLPSIVAVISRADANPPLMAAQRRVPNAVSESAGRERTCR